MRRKLPVPWRTNRSNVCRFPGAYHAAAYRLCRTLTEIEHRDDGAFKRYLPGPKTGGFVRGSFIAWRRHERVRDIEVVKDSIRELYDFEEVVGEEGFGKVSRARHRRTGEVVAIKTISKSKLGDEEALQLEVAFLKLSDHPNTVRYYETFEDATDIHLVMEMCSGGSLAQLLQNAHDDFGPGVSEDELKRISLQMLQGIAYCHAHSVAHRDIKPQNLLFSCGAPKNGSAIPISCSGHGDAPLKLVDFGIAGVVRNDRPEKRLLTKCAGTLGYMAPEVFGNKPYDGRSADLFSIGAVMHHMVVGVPPSWKAALNAYEFSGKMRYKQLSEDCQSLLEHLLHEVPEMRPTAAEALQHPWFDAEHSVSGGEDDMASLLERCFTRMNDFCQRSPLQKTIMYSTVAFAGLHNHHMEQLRVAFLFADRGNRGVAGGQGISCFEFVELGRKYSRFKPQELRQIFACANVSRNGKLSYCEWLAACAPAKWYGDTCNAERAFDTLDVKRNGFVGASDLCQLLPHALDKESIQEEILCSFPTGDGRLSFQDFVACSG